MKSRMMPSMRAWWCLQPLVRWLYKDGWDAETVCHAFNLLRYINGPWGVPVPMPGVVKMMAHITREVDPELPSKVVRDSWCFERALLSLLAGADTPLEAFSPERFSCNFTDVNVTVKDRKRYVLINIEINGMNAEDTHILAQYIAQALYEVCRVTGIRGSPFSEIRIPPYPGFGVKHLVNRYGDVIHESMGRLSVRLERSVAVRPFLIQVPQRLHLTDGTEVRKDGSFTSTAMAILQDMSEDGKLTEARLAASAGIRARTVQRRLKRENTNFASLVSAAKKTEKGRRDAPGW